MTTEEEEEITLMVYIEMPSSTLIIVLRPKMDIDSLFFNLVSAGFAPEKFDSTEINRMDLGIDMHGLEEIFKIAFNN